MGSRVRGRAERHQGATSGRGRSGSRSSRLAPGPNSRSRLLPRSSGQRWRARGRSIHSDPTSLKRSNTSIAAEVVTVSIAELQKLHPHVVVHVIFTIIENHPQFFVSFFQISVYIINYKQGDLELRQCLLWIMDLWSWRKNGSGSGHTPK